MNQTPTFRDVEQLSAYLDGQLPEAEVRHLNARLQAEPALAAIYKDLRQTLAMLRQTPKRRAPRNFTLTHKMAGIKPPLPRAVPVMRFVSVLAAFLLFATFAVNSIGPLAFGASAPATYGVGGGMGGGAPEDAAAEPPMMMEAAAEALVATEAPAEAPVPELRLLTPTLEPAATMMAMVPAPAEPTQLPDITNQVIPPAQPKTAPEEPGYNQPPTHGSPIARRWQVGLAVLAVLFGGSAFLLVRANDARWRRKK